MFLNQLLVREPPSHSHLTNLIEHVGEELGALLEIELVGGVGQVIPILKLVIGCQYACMRIDGNESTDTTDI